MKTGIDWQTKMQVVTPESVSFSYEVAGIGSRFLALLLDHLIEGFTLLALGLFFSAMGLLSSDWGPVLLAAGGFLFLIGYFILFEILWDGQTPGKRILHLRVVRDGGYGLTALESILRNLLRTIDLLHHAPGVRLKAIFTPEHGISGQADGKVRSTKDPRTGLPIYSLYGNDLRPTPKMLKGLDALVFDIQDAGVRFYTYISTMGVAMGGLSCARPSLRSRPITHESS